MPGAGHGHKAKKKMQNMQLRNLYSQIENLFKIEDANPSSLEANTVGRLFSLSRGGLLRQWLIKEHNVAQVPVQQPVAGQFGGFA